MKEPDRQTVTQLEDLPNIGKAMADDLRLTGIFRPQELVGKNAFELYDTLCAQSGKRHDPCVVDVFMSAIQFMEGSDALPWWAFTEQRKKIIADGRKRKRHDR